MKKKIAIDIDLTIVDVGIEWQDWLKFQYNHKDFDKFIDDCDKRQISYNLSEYFDILDKEEGFYFWKNSELYDHMELLNGCYDVIKNLWQAGFEIYFVSVTEPDHMNSKKDFLVRNFDFLDNINFVATDTKHCMDGCFAFIDDRMENINGIENENTLRILFDTPYKQDVESTQDYKLAKNWQDIEEFICDKMEEVL